MLEGIEYTLDFVKDESIALASIGKTILLSPTSQAVIVYASSCGVPNLKTQQDIEELWWRISYLRKFDFSVFGEKISYTTQALEPYLKDVQQLLGLAINEPPIARKQWLNKQLDFFINQNTDTYLTDKYKLAPQHHLVERPELLRKFIDANMNIKVPKNPTMPQYEQQDIPINPVIPQDLVLDENGRLPPIDLTKIGQKTPIIENVPPPPPQHIKKNTPNLPPHVLKGMEEMKKQQDAQKNNSL